MISYYIIGLISAGPEVPVQKCTELQTGFCLRGLALRFRTSTALVRKILTSLSAIKIFHSKVSAALRPRLSRSVGVAKREALSQVCTLDPTSVSAETQY